MCHWESVEDRVSFCRNIHSSGAWPFEDTSSHKPARQAHELLTHVSREACKTTDLYIFLDRTARHTRTNACFCFVFCFLNKTGKTRAQCTTRTNAILPLPPSPHESAFQSSARSLSLSQKINNKNKKHIKEYIIVILFILF